MAVTPNLKEAVRKATARAVKVEAQEQTDLQELSACVRDKTPRELAEPEERQKRREFLDAMYGEHREAQQAFERIINGNELQDVNFLPRGALVAQSVVRIVVRSGSRTLGLGTGFLVGEGVVLTNNHVLQSPDIARNSLVETNFQYGLEGEDGPKQTFALDVDRLFFTDRELDFTVVALVAKSDRGTVDSADLGWLPLIGITGKVMDGEWLTIVQHPQGERKQVCLRENQLMKRDEQVLWYSSDTLGGSSGSPVFNNDWLVVALHHSGVPEIVNGKWQTVDGHDYDPAKDDETKIKWVANEGIRVSRIVNKLKTDPATAGHPLIQALLDVGIDDVRARLPIMTRNGSRPPEITASAVRAASAPARSPSTETNMTRRLINVTLAVEDDGTVSVRDQSASESFLLEAAVAKKKKPVIEAPVNPKTDWLTGFDPEFLGKGELRVNLPEVVTTEKIAPLNKRNPYTGKDFADSERAAGVLAYNGYSVVMNKDRRFAFYSAANVDGGMAAGVSGRDDNWLFDDRISRNYQVDNSYYAHDKFDRGHLTRRDDMEWGKEPVEAVRRANGTCTWTNCSPQHEIFNKGQDHSVLLWQQLERFILEQTALAHKFRVQVITGPIFGAADPVYREIPYPLEFWKVVVAVSAKNALFATGYVLGQKETIAKYGLEEALEVPFGAFGTYQRPIGVIENVTGLRFTYGDGRKPLSEVDPLSAPTWRLKQRRKSARAEEALEEAGDDALESFDDIVLQ